MKESKDGTCAFIIEFKDEDFLDGDCSYVCEFKDLYDLYQRDTLAMSIVRSWILMEIKHCREHFNIRIGLIDPTLVH
uniref:Uncharacterized protein n=1 Tax=Arundo donax TaxID=35708 RepID=A0A0A9CME6_ARUDO